VSCLPVSVTREDAGDHYLDAFRHMQYRDFEIEVKVTSRRLHTFIGRQWQCVCVKQLLTQAH